MVNIKLIDVAAEQLTSSQEDNEEQNTSSTEDSERSENVSTSSYVSTERGSKLESQGSSSSTEDNIYNTSAYEMQNDAMEDISEQGYNLYNMYNLEPFSVKDNQGRSGEEPHPYSPSSNYAPIFNNENEFDWTARESEREESERSSPIVYNNAQEEDANQSDDTMEVIDTNLLKGQVLLRRHIIFQESANISGEENEFRNTISLTLEAEMHSKQAAELLKNIDLIRPNCRNGTVGKSPSRNEIFTNLNKGLNLKGQKQESTKVKNVSAWPSLSISNNDFEDSNDLSSAKLSELPRPKNQNPCTSKSIINRDHGLCPKNTKRGSQEELDTNLSKSKKARSNRHNFNVSLEADGIVEEEPSDSINERSTLLDPEINEFLETETEAMRHEQVLAHINEMFKVSITRESSEQSELVLQKAYALVQSSFVLEEEMQNGLSSVEIINPFSYKRQPGFPTEEETRILEERNIEESEMVAELPTELPLVEGFIPSAFYEAMTGPSIRRVNWEDIEDISGQNSGKGA